MNYNSFNFKYIIYVLCNTMLQSTAMIFFCIILSCHSDVNEAY